MVKKTVCGTKMYLIVCETLHTHLYALNFRKSFECVRAKKKTQQQQFSLMNQEDLRRMYEKPVKMITPR